MEDLENNSTASTIFKIIVALVPVFGVLFLGWNAFDPLFIYVAESGTAAYFGTKKRNLYFSERSKRSGRKIEGQGSAMLSVEIGRAHV